MALYHQLIFPSTFIEHRSVREWKGVVVISNFDRLETASSNRSIVAGLGLSTFSWVFFQGGEWVTMEGKVG